MAVDTIALARRGADGSLVSEPGGYVLVVAPHAGTGEGVRLELLGKEVVATTGTRT